MSICEIFPIIADYTSQGKRVILVTKYSNVPIRSVFVDGKLIIGSKEHEDIALEAEKKGSKIEIEKNGIKIIAEVIEPRPAIVLVGSGVIAKEIFKLANTMGFIVEVVAEDAKEEDFPEAKFFSNTLQVLEQLSSNSFVIVANEGGKPYDIPAAYTALKAKAKYVGFLSSQKRAAYTIAQLIKMGIPIEELKERFYGPMGLDINAKTAEEIALSALSELILIMRKGSGKHLRDVKDPYPLLKDAMEGKISDVCNFTPIKIS
jgi:xanthine dehydrogenase accessory factor